MASKVPFQKDHVDNDSIELHSSDVRNDAERIDVVDHFPENESNHDYDEDNYDDDGDHEEMIYNVGSNDSTVPVGITIAYKRYVSADTSADETMRPSSAKQRQRMKSPPQHPKSKRSAGSNTAKPYRDNKKKSKVSAHKSLQVLLDSSLIYIFCMIIPPFLAYVYHNIIQEITWDSIKSLVSNDGKAITNASSSFNARNEETSYSYYSFLNPFFQYLNEYQSYQYVKSTVYEPTIHYMCTPNSNYDSASNSSSYNYYSSYIWNTVLEQTGLCPPEYSHLRLQPRRSVISDDMSIYMDVFYITICSFLLAMIRLLIVHYTIFKNGDNNVHALTSNASDTNISMTMSNVDALTVLVRCKSNHLLSSDYHIVTSTPDHSSHTRRVKKMSLDAISQCMVTNLNATAQNDNNTNQSSDSAPRKLNLSDDDGNSTNMETFGYIVDISDRDTQSETRPFDDDTDHQSAILRMNPLAVGIPADKDSTANNMASSRDETLLRDGYEGVDEVEEEKRRHEQQQQQREYRKLIYAAPRYATAIFRLLYCSITAGIALVYFRHADFWPWFVLGTGRGTKQCWDLSGGITVGGMDSDFDQHNAVLKRYFLWQASYHIHSSTFHFLLSMVFLFYPFVSSTTATDNNDSLEQASSSPSKRLRGIKRGSDAYVRSFIQHLLSVVLIAVAYIFSSLRRLGAIGLFAFDVSSWSLHLLQICINAPDDSYLWYLLPPKYQKQKRSFIRGLYLFLVVPSFVIARFIIWPALWYSVAYESQSWLKQLEMTLWPGSALLLRIIMHTLMLILHCISLLYLRRLLFYRVFSK